MNGTVFNVPQFNFFFFKLSYFLKFPLEMQILFTDVFFTFNLHDIILLGSECIHGIISYETKPSYQHGSCTNVLK